MDLELERRSSVTNSLRERCDRGRRWEAWRGMQLALDGSEDGGRGHKPRNAGGLGKPGMALS